MLEPLTRHEDSFLTLAQTAVERRFDMPYRKTFAFDGETLSAQHATQIANLHPTGMIDIGVEGWPLPADALKLYEMAYCCTGDILELGAYHFGFAFIDHSHQYGHVQGVQNPAPRRRPRRVRPVPRLQRPAQQHGGRADYGVYQGAMDGLRTDRWAFWGIYGCTGLFRRIGPC